MASNPVTNIFKSGQIDTDIHENLDGLSKEITIKNSGTATAYVRARVSVSGVDASKLVFSAPADPAAAKASGDSIWIYPATSGGWQTVGTAAADSYWYYCKQLPAGATTDTALMVIVGGGVDTTDPNFRVIVYHESVLAVGSPVTAPSDIEAQFTGAK